MSTLLILCFFPSHWLISYIGVFWPMPFLRHVSRGNLAISKLLRKAEDRKLGFDNHSTTFSQQTMSSYGETPWIPPGWMAVVPHSSRLFWHEGAESIEYLYSRFVQSITGLRCRPIYGHLDSRELRKHQLPVPVAKETVKPMGDICAAAEPSADGAPTNKQPLDFCLVFSHETDELGIEKPIFQSLT